MKIIRYTIPKRESIMFILLLVIPFTYMTIFSFDSFHIFNIYIIAYFFRYIIYITCFLGCIWASKMYLLFRKRLHVLIVDEKIIARCFSSDERISIPIDSVEKIIITIKEIRLFYIKKENCIEENSIENQNTIENQNSIENNKVETLETKKDLKIPLIHGGFMHEDDFLYIIELFKDIDVEYDNITQKEVYELISNQTYKGRTTCVNIICIVASIILFINLIFILMFIFSY